MSQFSAEIFMPLIRERISSLLTSSLPVMNCRFPPYVKGLKTQDKGINTNFENLVGDATRQVLTSLGIAFTSAILDVKSDVSIETDDFILQVDAKGCHVGDGDQEFAVKKTGHFHGRCGIAQTSLVSTALFNGTEQRGLQRGEIDGKPVYTFIVFMRWGYDTEYYVESCGVVHLPHSPEDFGFKVGKSGDEMRWVIKNPALYQVHRFASESPSRIPDSAQSECNDVPTTSQQFQ